MENLPDYTARLAQKQQLNDALDLIACRALQTPPPERLARVIAEKAGVSGMNLGNSQSLERSIAQPVEDLAVRDSVIGKLRSLGSIDSEPLVNLASLLTEPTSFWVDESAPLPLARLSFGNLELQVQKICTMIAGTTELFRLTSPQRRNLLLKAVQRALIKNEDRKSLSDDAETAAAPAGLLAGLQPSGGGSPSMLEFDLEQQYADVSDGDPQAPVWVLSGRVAMHLQGTNLHAFKDLGVVDSKIAGAPALISAQAANNLILVDAAALAVFFGGMEIESSNAPAVEMLDNPTNDSGVPTPTQVVSAFQAGARVARLIRYVSWKKLRGDAVAYLALPDIGGSPF